MLSLKIRKCPRKYDVIRRPANARALFNIQNAFGTKVHQTRSKLCQVDGNLCRLPPSSKKTPIVCIDARIVPNKLTICCQGEGRRKKTIPKEKDDGDEVIKSNNKKKPSLKLIKFHFNQPLRRLSTFLVCFEGRAMRSAA